MRKLVLLFSLSMFLNGQAQILKTINVTNPGELSTLLTEEEKSSITNLTVTGTIDVRDFKCMRSQMPLLSTIDLKESNIAAYGGEVVTHPEITYYPADEIPALSFYNYYTSKPKETLKSIVLPLSLLSIGRSAFFSCSGITSIDIGNSITTIGLNAFLGCSGLTTVKMGNSVTTIKDCAFEYCTALRDFTLSNQLTYIGTHAFDDCTSFKKLFLPSSLTTIGDHAFSDCTGLTEVTIPSSVTSIQMGAFAYCTGLRTIYCLNPIPPVCDNYCFTLVSVTNIYVPASSVNTYKNAIVWGDSFYSQITTIPAAGINNPANRKIKVYSTHSEIIIEGADNGEEIKVYSLNGELIHNNKFCGKQMSIPIKTRSIFVVRTENETFKVSL